MADSQDDKKGFPGGMFLFLLSMILVFSMVQNFMSLKVAKVSFSHQVEHLVNLGLIVPEESRKIAQNDKLVTFTGRFRETVPELGKKRYKYLRLLNDSFEITDKQEALAKEIADSKDSIFEAADWFLHISGVTVPPGGYRVVDENFDVSGFSGGVVITKLSDKNIGGLREVDQAMVAAISDPSENNVKQVGRAVATLVRNFRSPILGIGAEPVKLKLKSIDQEVIETSLSQSQDSSALKVYQGAVSEVKEIIRQIDTEEDHVRLTQLRAVRKYKDDLVSYQLLLKDRDENTLRLEKAREEVASSIWFFNNEELSTKALEKVDPEKFSHWFQQAKKEWENFDKNRSAYFKAPDQQLNLVLEKTFRSEEPAPNYFSYLMTMLPVFLVVLVLYFLFARQMKGAGSSAMNFGKSPAKLLKEGQTKVTFADVAGIDEAKEELTEIVDFLKNPAKFTALGAKIPKGVLCVGPPGTGKTLIAKAVAGEANCPFFSISGSDFVEMFVGVGASRIRDMFDTAKKNAPCIVFIDEIDAVGRHRGAGIGGGHDEREQTLNQLLVEMDGFDTNEGVILIAATNRPDVLDKALLRPGRFDRQVVIDLPDIKGRHEILKLHAKKIKMDGTVDLLAIAKGTPGASGADLGNLLNEAALLAARKDRSMVTADEVNEARDKVLYGKERRSMELDKEEKWTTAIHESGHAVVGLLVEKGDPVDKVTIIPRGRSLGATHFLPEKNKVSYWRKEVVDQLAVLMGGRCAEEIFLKDFSSGASQDIEQATRLARMMVCKWGMSELLGKVAYEESEANQYLGGPSFRDKRYSEQTAQLIDAEVKRLIEEAYERAKELLTEHKKEVQLMSEMLMEFETLDKEDVREIVLDHTWDPERKKVRLATASHAFKLPPQGGDIEVGAKPTVDRTA